MKSNVTSFRPPAAAAAVVEAEPLDAAVLEVSARLAENAAERRRLFARLDELRGLTPERRRKRARALPEVTEPLTFSIEEAGAGESLARLQVARG